MDDNTLTAIRYCVGGAVILALFLGGAIDLNTVIAFVGGLALPTSNLLAGLKK